MLKIVECNKITGEKVDLKELEKFGFKPKYDEDTGKIYRYIYEYEFCGTKKLAIEVQKDFHMRGQYDYVEYWKVELIEFEGLDKIYDLIQAGLVEKE